MRAVLTVGLSLLFVLGCGDTYDDDSSGDIGGDDDVSDDDGGDDDVSDDDGGDDDVSDDDGGDDDVGDDDSTDDDVGDDDDTGDDDTGDDDSSPGQGYSTPPQGWRWQFVSPDLVERPNARGWRMRNGSARK